MEASIRVSDRAGEQQHTVLNTSGTQYRLTVYRKGIRQTGTVEWSQVNAIARKYFGSGEEGALQGLLAPAGERAGPKKLIIAEPVRQAENQADIFRDVGQGLRPMEQGTAAYQHAASDFLQEIFALFDSGMVVDEEESDVDGARSGKVVLEDDEIAGLKEHIACLQLQNQQLTTSVEGLTAQLQTWTDRDEEDGRASKALAAASARLDETKAHCAHLEEQLTQAQAAIQGKNDQLSQIRALTDEQKTEIAALSEKLLAQEEVHKEHIDTIGAVNKADLQRLQGQLDLATQKIAQLRDENHRLQAELNEAKAAKLEADRQCAALQKGLDARGQEFTSATAKAAAAETRVQGLLDKIAMLEARIEQLEAEKVQLQAELEKRLGLEAEIARLQATLTGKEEALNQAGDTERHLRASLKSAEEGRQRALEELTSLRQRLRAAQADKNAAAATNTELHRRIDQLQQTDDSSALIADLRGELAASKGREGAASQRAERLQSQVDALTAQSQQSADEAAQARRELETLRTTHATLTRSHTELEAQLARLTAKKEELQGQIGALAAANVTQGTELETLRSKLQAAKTRAEQLAAEKANLEAAHATELEQLQKDKARVEAGFEKVKAELDALRSNSTSDQATLSDRIPSLTSQLEDATTENATLQTRIADLEFELEQLKNESATANTDAAAKQSELQATIDSLEEEKATASQKVTELESRLHDIQEGKSTVEGELAALKQQNEDLEATITQLRSELEQLKRSGVVANTEAAAKQGQLQATIDNLHSQKEAAEAKATALQAEFDQVKKDANEAAAIAQAQIDELTSSLATMQAARSELEADKDELVNTHAAEIGGLESAKAQAGEQVDALRAQLAAAKGAAARAGESLAGVQSELAALRVQLDEKDTTIAELRASLEALQSDEESVDDFAQMVADMSLDDSSLLGQTESSLTVEAVRIDELETELARLREFHAEEVKRIRGNIGQRVEEGVAGIRQELAESEKNVAKFEAAYRKEMDARRAAERKACSLGIQIEDLQGRLEDLERTNRESTQRSGALIRSLRSELKGAKTQVQNLTDERDTQARQLEAAKQLEVKHNHEIARRSGVDEQLQEERLISSEHERKRIEAVRESELARQELEKVQGTVTDLDATIKRLEAERVRDESVLSRLHQQNQELSQQHEEQEALIGSMTRETLQQHQSFERAKKELQEQVDTLEATVEQLGTEHKEALGAAKVEQEAAVAKVRETHQKHRARYKQQLAEMQAELRAMQPYRLKNWYWMNDQVQAKRDELSALDYGPPAERTRFDINRVERNVLAIQNRADQLLESGEDVREAVGKAKAILEQLSTGLQALNDELADVKAEAEHKYPTYSRDYMQHLTQEGQDLKKIGRELPQGEMKQAVGYVRKGTNRHTLESMYEGRVVALERTIQACHAKRRAFAQKWKDGNAALAAISGGLKSKLIEVSSSK